MRRILRFLLLKPVLWAATKFSSRPQRDRVFKALDELHQSLLQEPGKKGPVLEIDISTDKFIIFSDQHKGARNGADDFTLAEPNYLAALDHYAAKGFTFVSLGDSEELWENTIWSVKKHNKATFEAERKFCLNGKFIKVYGNHDLYWNMNPFATFDLKSIYGSEVKIAEGVLLKANLTRANDSKDYPLSILFTHGHQGDAQSDGNWFSKTFVSLVWAPLQGLLRINPNTPAYNAEKKTLHNDIMYEWSVMQENLLLITGHTHQPVFRSLTHLEKLYKDYQLAEFNNQQKEKEEIVAVIKKVENDFTAVSIDYMNMKPSYFNSGCCCFSDGDITGIEIEGGFIRLIKWTGQNAAPNRIVLEEAQLNELIAEI